MQFRADSVVHHQGSCLNKIRCLLEVIQATRLITVQCKGVKITVVIMCLFEESLEDEKRVCLGV